ncbi:hypothetical protein [Sulfuriroseicoccus oceanibius]|uniref:Uncharacterized protein n=1 Tax=Sulfuriroseicoccus oceanibius TaxID=2707525 RepID=A0A6B3LAM2_9BACT|nr:hypothetical protein [Sulfuriroseicoccus oceanibius]QQL43897.1 hypothetical protein G3M56_008305 [Sulfuriroseicoccus oceanibius]
MAQQRRRKRQTNSSPAKGLIIGATGLILVGGIAMIASRSLSGDTPDRQTPLPVLDYYNNSENLRGNVYSLQGTVKHRDRITGDSQLITLMVQTPSEERPMPVIIPGDIGATNIEPGFVLNMIVEVNAEGIPQATKILEL